METYPLTTPKSIEKFVLDFYVDPINFLSDAIQFSKASDWTINFETEISKEGKALVKMMYFTNKVNTKIYYEFEVATKTLT
jgi:hypothetical protein